VEESPQATAPSSAVDDESEGSEQQLLVQVQPSFEKPPLVVPFSDWSGEPPLTELGRQPTAKVASSERVRGRAFMRST
jgi:hypothetical protein